jgi:hypothetical protein
MAKTEDFVRGLLGAHLRIVVGAGCSRDEPGSR